MIAWRFFGMALAFLDGIELSQYRESLKTSLEIATISSSDVRKQFAIIREILSHGGNPISFGMIVRVLGVTKGTISEHYTRYPAQ
jgi:DNA-binding MarR family transcriptional regulator